VEVKKIDYADQASLVEALQGQDALIITMSVRAPPDQQTKLIEAAATADVAWVLPNEWGYDTSNAGLRKDIPMNDKHKYLDQIEQLGRSSWIGVTCGFWYEYSLSSGPPTYGFDFKNRAVTFIDDGNTHVNTSTWIQCGRAVAKLLAFKVSPDDANDTSPCLTHYKNKFIYISSFNLSQRDILDSVMRVTGTTLDDWKIEHEESPSRYKAGMEAMKKGDYKGFAQMMYTRVFYQDGSGSYEASKGLQNDVLGLPKEDLDEYTKIAVQLAEKA
jgi:NmrA-like family